MSLDKVASHLAAQGRGPDTTLVHMSPREVGALQGIARQHGGSLTINPQTGLAEAGFLDAILPMVAGAGLSLIPGVGPLMAAGIVGGGTALLTKDLNKGLMAGLGAFGGASLAGGLMGAGTAAGTGAEGAAGALGVQGAATGPGSQAAMLAEQTAAFGPEGIESIRSAANTATGVTQTAAPTAFDQMQSGFQNTKFDADFLKKNMFPIGAAAAPLLMGGTDGLFGGGEQKKAGTDSYIRPQTYSQTRNPNYTGAGTPYFTQSYTAGEPVLASEWGNRSFAEGGAVDPLGISALGPQATTEGFAPVVTYDPVTRQYVNAAPTGASPTGNNFTYDAATQTYGPAAPPATGLPAISANQMSYYDAGNSGGGADSSNSPDMDGTNSDAGADDGSEGSDGSDGGANGSGEGWAEGGITNSKMAAVDKYVATAQSGQQGMQQVMALAKSGDYNAAIAINKLNASPNQNYAMGGIASLGSYSDGGRLLKGPGDGVSDSIPAIIGDRQPARLANEEFVVPARIVSEIGNGSSEAGAKELYKMMERVQDGREKSIGKGKVAVDSKAYKHLPV